MQFLRRVVRSLRFRIFVKDKIPFFARRAMNTKANQLLNLSLRLLGFNNHGSADKSGENYFLECFAKTNPLFCVDVGANVGRYSRYLLTHSSSFVIAFEPLPGAFEKLKLLKKEFGTRFTIVNQGCADKSGPLKLNFGDELSELASFSPEVNGIDYVGKSNVNSINLQTTSLDDYFHSNRLPAEARCDLLKIDTEGYEFEVMKGAVEFIKAHRPRVIQIEFNLHHLFRGHSLKLLTQDLTQY